ncbi:MAG: signal recognition particle receptor subunit alpha, partial [Lachnospiraceae bacterium]|nr:signal recognition particle receptor subunit alpha [Lachnospiraceae bacterium]
MAKGLFGRLAAGLAKTKNQIVSGIDEVFNGVQEIDDDFFDDLEEVLIMSDLGINATTAIIEALKNRVAEDGIRDARKCKKLLVNSIKQQMKVQKGDFDFENVKSVVLVIGVNGVGKTTTVGKLAAQYR